jgi:F-type H+-transporting ATPase subunit b
MGAIETFGLTFGNFFAQVIIFLVVYLVLKKYAFGPVTAILEQRRQRIEEGEEKLRGIAEKEANAEVKALEAIDRANSEADRLVAEAKESAAQFEQRARAEASREAEQIIAKAREVGEMEREQMFSTLKAEFGRMVADATSRATGKVLNDDDRRRLDKEAASQIAL